MWTKLSSSYVGQPAYPADGDNVIVKYDWVAHDGALVKSATTGGGGDSNYPLFQVAYGLGEDNNLATINIDFDHNTLQVGKLYKVKIHEDEVRGFLIREDGNLEQFKNV